MKTLTKVALSNNKKNKTRSLLIICVISLTTMLITAIGTFGNGLIKNNREQAEALYGNYVGAFANIGDNQLHEMRKRGEFEEIGLMAYVGEANTKGKSLLVWEDDKALLMTNGYSMFSEGNLPEKKNEIAASKVFFEQVGYENVQIGNKVEISIRKNGMEAFQKDEFVVSGILKDEIGNENQQSSKAFVSKEYYDSKVVKGQEQYLAYFNFNENIKGNYDEIDAVIKKIAKECGIDEKNVIQNGYFIVAKYAPTSEVLFPCVLISFVVIIFAVVVIYNIFQIGIAYKVQEYGKIKAIGATKKQMKKIIVREGLFLSAIAIPIGLLVGYFVTEFLFHIIMEMARESNEYLPVENSSIFSPMVIIISALVSLVTVRIALARAVKIVTSITPVQAFEYEDSIVNTKGYKKGHKALNIAGLIKAELIINKKRTMISIFIMGISCVLFIIISSLVSSIDVEYEVRKSSVERGDYQIELNFDNSDQIYKENNLDQIIKNNPITDDIIEEFENIDGVEKIETRNYLTFQEDGIVKSVAIFDREGFEKELEKPSVVGDFTYDSVSEADGFIYPWAYFMEENGEKIGDKIEVELKSEKSNAKYTGTAMGAFANVEADYVITKDTARKLGLYDKSYAYLWVWCNSDSAKMTVENKINDLYKDDVHIYWESYDHAYKLSEKTVFITRILANIFLGLIGTISFLNMANIIIMNVITRKKEFGVLQAVGMSNRQFGKMLQFEGMFFIMGSIFISLFIGLPIGYIAFLYCREKSFFGLNKYNFPVTEILLMVAILLVMQMILSFVLSRNVKKESIVDRIRF